MGLVCSAKSFKENGEYVVDSIIWVVFYSSKFRKLVTRNVVQHVVLH